jgi:membrane-bound lytic murein transglycosylase D
LGSELPKETMRYVPRILAAMVIGHYPEQYDMKINRQYRPDFDTVTVFDSFPLEEVAKVLKVPEDTLRSLNMELVKWCTPPNRDSYLLRLPVGTRSAFVDGYDKMEKNNFSSWHHHKVKRGESLGVISRQYGISVKELQQANDMKGTRIRAGQTLLIPIKVTPKKSTGKKPAKVKTYVAKLGDNVATVARLFGVSQESIRVWNSMKEDHVVNPGDTLFVSKPELKPVVPQASSAPKLAKGERYVVGEGDTYAEIAKKFGVPVVMLLEANGGYSHRLSVGDSLVIPEFTQTVVKNAPKSSERQAKADKSSGEKSSAKPAKAIDKQAGSASAKSEKSAKERVHVVKKGEGLWDISRQYGVTIEDIVRWNNLKDTKIRIGDKLIIRK